MLTVMIIDVMIAEIISLYQKLFKENERETYYFGDDDDVGD